MEVHYLRKRLDDGSRTLIGFCDVYCIYKCDNCKHNNPYGCKQLGQRDCRLYNPIKPDLYANHYCWVDKR